MSEVYISCTNAWNFSGSPWTGASDYVNDMETSYRVGDVNKIEGYAVVINAKIEQCNGVYHFDDSNKSEFCNHYSKCSSKKNHFLKWSPTKGIKIVPRLNTCGFREKLQRSPKNDDKIANLRWDLIQNTKKQINNGIDVRFTFNQERATSYYEYLMSVDSFEYKYFYKFNENEKNDADKNSNINNTGTENCPHVEKNQKLRLVNVLDSNFKNENDRPFCFFIQNFAYHPKLYPDLVQFIPKRYQQMIDIEKRIEILNGYLDGIAYLSNIIVYEFLDGEDNCIHSNITHFIYDIEKRYETLFYHTFLCDKCEKELSIPDINKDGVNEQISFISRVKRSFGIEYNGSKFHNHRNRFHSFKLKKFIIDEKHCGMTHIYTGNKNINIYTSDRCIFDNYDKPKTDKKNCSKKCVIDIIKPNEKIIVFWSKMFLMFDNIFAISTRNGVVGYIMIEMRYIEQVRVDYDEIVKFINDNNIIISSSYVKRGENVIERLRYSMEYWIDGLASSDDSVSVLSTAEDTESGDDGDDDDGDDVRW